MNKEKNIPGVHNYCDKWCEKCKFTSRCAVYEATKDKILELNDEKFFENLKNAFNETMEMIKDTVTEWGEDWDTFVEEANKMEIKIPEYTSHQEKIIRLSEKYIEDVSDWFESNTEYFKSKEDEYNQSLKLGIDIKKTAFEINDAIEVIQWYLYFINFKILRAFSGLNEEVDDDLPEEFRDDPIQNDHNGTAKIAKIAIQNSIEAWRILHDILSEKSDEILDFLLLLSNIESGLVKELPDMDKFIRPGFDE